MAGVGSGDPHGQGAPARQPGQRRGEAETDAGRSGTPPRHLAQAAVRAVESAQLFADGAHHQELRCALHEVHHARRELAALRGLPRLLPTCQATRQPWDRRGREEEGHQENETSLGEEPPKDRHRSGADERRHQERLQHPEHDVLQRIDVIDEARHEITPAEGGEPRGRHCLEPSEHAHPEVGQHPEGGVVADQPFAVAEEAP